METDIDDPTAVYYDHREELDACYDCENCGEPGPTWTIDYTYDAINDEQGIVWAWDTMQVCKKCKDGNQ